MMKRTVVVVALLAILAVAPLPGFHPLTTASATASTGFGFSGDPVWLKVNIPASNGAGEPTLGVGWTLTGGTSSSGGVATGTTSMFMGRLSQFRTTYDDSVSPPTASTTEVTHPGTLPIGFDPILYTDFQTGRTWAGELEVAGPGVAGLAPGNAGCTNLAYTDDNGATWTLTADACSIPGWDHESVGAGPWAGGPPTPALPPNGVYNTPYQHVVYYCSQYPMMFCWESRDGGRTFLPGANGGVVDPSLLCGGLHGHVRVAQDGTAYLPNRNCGGRTGFAYTTNNGDSWGLREIVDTHSGTGSFDPSVGISMDKASGASTQRIYVGQAEASGAYVGVSDDRGATWNTVGTGSGAPAGTKYYNLLDEWNANHPAAQSLAQAEFAELISGDLNRAAYAFLGTHTTAAVQPKGTCGTTNGMTWDLYVAFTYDGGSTWDVQKASPDPVQKDGIWPGGGSATCRNLLDFNDIAVDHDGRVLVSYADGCTGTCDSTPASGTVGFTPTHDQAGTILRQYYGCGLFAAKDASGGGCNSATGSTGTALAANAGGPYSGTAGTAISITGTATGGVTPYTCAWSGSGASFASSTSCSTTVTYTSSGTKTLSLTVTDAASTANTATATVTVSAAALSANAGGPYTGTVSTPIAITGSGAGGTSPYTCSWAGTGASFASSTSCSTTVTYASSGTKTLTLTVTDAASSTATSTASVNVGAATPTCFTDSATDSNLVAVNDPTGLFELTKACAQDLGTTSTIEVTLQTVGMATENLIGVAASPVLYQVYVDSPGHVWNVFHSPGGAWTVTKGTAFAASAGTASSTSTTLTVDIPYSEISTAAGYAPAKFQVHTELGSGPAHFVGLDIDAAPNTFGTI